MVAITFLYVESKKFVSVRGTRPFTMSSKKQWLAVAVVVVVVIMMVVMVILVAMLVMVIVVVMVVVMVMSDEICFSYTMNSVNE